MTRREELMAIIQAELDTALAPFKGKISREGLVEAVVATFARHIPAFVKPEDRYVITSEEVAPGVFSCTVEDLWLGEQWKGKT